MNPLNPEGTQALTLSSGPPHTVHADFWNTWQQERLDQLVRDCLAARVRCGSVDATSTIEWSRQFGTTRYDLAYASAPDGDGGAYVVGFTNLALEGLMAAGGDGYPNVAGRVTSRDLLDEVVADFISANTPISPAIQGRIVCTTSGATACPVLL